MHIYTQLDVWHCLKQNKHKLVTFHAITFLSNCGIITTNNNRFQATVIGLSNASFTRQIKLHAETIDAMVNQCLVLLTNILKRKLRIKLI